MGISFVGHSNSFEIWVFDVNGKRFVARNFSTQTPLKLRFAGLFSEYSGGSPLIKTSGFNISDSTATTATWQWAGNQYQSYWQIEYDDIEDPEATVKLVFGPPVPYSGPPVAPVGTGGVTNTQSPPPAAIPPIVPSLPIDQNQNIMGGGQDQVRIPTPVISRTPVIPPASVTAAPVTGTDWVKLGIQLGVAYFILS